MARTVINHDDVTWFAATTVSVGLAVANGFFLIEIIHNVFAVAMRMLAAGGTVLVLPIILATLIVAFGIPPLYRWAQGQFLLSVWFLGISSIQCMALGSAILIRTRLLAWLTSGTTDDILFLVGPVYEPFGWGLFVIALLAGVSSIYLKVKSKE
ncbi:MAG: hypothetical protein ACLFNQ_07535 [Spirochaetaceae bacterium]